MATTVDGGNMNADITGTTVEIPENMVNVSVVAAWTGSPVGTVKVKRPTMIQCGEAWGPRQPGERQAARAIPWRFRHYLGYG